MDNMLEDRWCKDCSIFYSSYKTDKNLRESSLKRFLQKQYIKKQQNSLSKITWWNRSSVIYLSKLLNSLNSYSQDMNFMNNFY